MIIEREHPLPDEIWERYQRAMSSPDVSPLERQQLASMMGLAMMLTAATKLMLDDLAIR